jgi:hypothetical protein
MIGGNDDTSRTATTPTSIERMTPPAAWRVENAFLLAAIGTSVALHPAPVPGTSLDWDYLIRAAHLHGVSPLLHAATESNGSIPEAARNALRTAWWTTHFRNRMLVGELKEILAAAHVRQISLMPLKGALLAPRYYSTPALRPMSDLDLLVRPHDLHAATDLLSARGYTALAPAAEPVTGQRPHPYHQEYVFVRHHPGEPMMVELRAEPLDPVGMGFLTLDRTLERQLRRNVADIWERSYPDCLDGVPFVRIAPGDLLLHIASHLTTRHTNFRLLWLHDLCAVLAQHEQSIDWPCLMENARAIRVQVPVLAALEAARTLLGAPVPVQRLQWSCLPTFAVLERAEYRLFMRQVRAFPTADLGTVPMIPVWLIPVSLLRLLGFRARFRAVCALIAPDRAYMAQWTAETVSGSVGYRRALFLRTFLGMLRMATLASARVRTPRLSRAIQRFAIRTANLLHLSLVPPDRGETAPQRWL